MISNEHHIISIEDEVDIQEIIAYKLQKADYSVTLADEGAKGLLLAQAQLPDLILLDVILPSLTGMQVCERLKADLKPNPLQSLCCQLEVKKVKKVTL